MKNRLKEYRNLRSLTQEELAESSGISIRTIQRIENDLSTSSAHTIKALAKALNINNTDLLPTDDDVAPLSGDHKLKLLNFSVLTVWLIPFGNIIFPAIIFVRNRGSRGIKIIGGRILSFQIVGILILPFLMAVFFLVLGRGPGQVPMPIAIAYIIYGLINSMITVYNAIRINQQKSILTFVPNLVASIMS